MSNPRYVPRDLFPNPKQFGSAIARAADHCGPQPSDPFERSQWLAAQLQWEVASHVKRAFRNEKRSHIEVAELIGWRRERLTKMLRGYSVMAMEDMFLLIGVSGGGWTKVAGAVGYGSAGIQLQELHARGAYLEGLLESNRRQIVDADRSVRKIRDVSAQRRSATPTQS